MMFVRCYGEMLHSVLQNASYKGEFSASHPTVRMFWDVFHEFPLENKKQFLCKCLGALCCYSSCSVLLSIQTHVRRGVADYRGNIRKASRL